MTTSAPSQSSNQRSQIAHVPSGLRAWFIFHCVADLLFAIPLLIDPAFALGLLGWTPEAVDPINARISASALMGIGLESWLCRDSSVEVYRSMLNLKSIWSICAWVSVLGVMLTLPTEQTPWGGWLIFTIFFIFSGVWNGYRVKLRRPQ